MFESAIINLFEGATIDLSIVIYLILAEAMAGLLAFIFWIYNTYIKKTIRCRLLENAGGKIKCIAEIAKKPGSIKWNYKIGKKDRVYLINPKMFTFDGKDNAIGYWWKDHSAQIPIGIEDLNKIKIKVHPIKEDGTEDSSKWTYTFIDPEQLQTELESKDMSDLSHADDYKIFLIIIAVMGVLIVATGIAGFYFYNTQTQNYIDLSNRYSSLLANYTALKPIIK